MKITFKNPNKNHPSPFFRYQMFSVCKVENEKYPDMVEISRGPKWGKEIIGKRYLDESYAVKAIDLFKGNHLIDKSKVKVLKTLENEGYDVDAALEGMSE
jgi:hypothetical protein